MRVEVQADPAVNKRLRPEVETALFRVAHEALTNACKHAEADWACVSLSLSEDAVELVVEDDGKGFDLEREVRANSQGGLGMHGMRERAALLRGELTVDTAPGKGTRVVLVVPLEGVGAEGELPPQPGAAAAGITVLLVDDHAMFREGLRSVLDVQPGITVIGEAEDGRQAVQLVEKLRPDVVIMDIAMPNLNGLDATSQIKRRFPDVKVIILTTYDSREYIVQMVKIGAAGCMPKRSAGTELVTAIHGVMQGQSYI
jgi:CheY-like chemotaxis protein